MSDEKNQEENADSGESESLSTSAEDLQTDLTVEQVESEEQSGDSTANQADSDSVESTSEADDPSLATASSDSAVSDDADADVEEDDEEEEEEEVDMNVQPLEEISPEEAEVDAEKDWYILKVQSNRENSICDALRRRVKVAGLDEYFDEVTVPVREVVEFRGGKRRITKKKLYPGYICVNMAINDETWFLVRETPGIGDFAGAAGKPSPMLKHEVESAISKSTDGEDGDQVKTAIPFSLGDRVRIKEGTFENFEGDVDEIDEASGRIIVMINIFGRSTPVQLPHWQIEDV